MNRFGVSRDAHVCSVSVVSEMSTLTVWRARLDNEIVGILDSAVVLGGLGEGQILVE